jgi:two-component system response regulator WspF
MRIGIVNDVPLAAEAIRRVLVGAGEHRVAWIAFNGAEAIGCCASDRPDLVLMDLIMPGIDGVETTRRIMAQSPCAILVVTADVSVNSARVFEALGAGALDAVNTPVLESPGSKESARALLRKIDTIRRLIGGGGVGLRALPPRPNPPQPRPRRCLVGIGASAGGPAALATILSALPAGFAAPLVVVQHVDAGFMEGLARWLDQKTPLDVRLARQGDRPEPGLALLAGRDSHLVFVSPTRLGYVPAVPRSYYRPSIDAFFASAARNWKDAIVGVLLTGMGCDGAAGLRELREMGHFTIAQDRPSSAVYGMPKAAVESGSAIEILALDRIAAKLVEIVAGKPTSHG